MLANYARLLELKIFEQQNNDSLNNTEYTIDGLFKNKKTQNRDSFYFRIWRRIYDHIYTRYGTFNQTLGALRITLNTDFYATSKYGYITWVISPKTKHCAYTIITEEEYNKLPANHKYHINLK